VVQLPDVDGFEGGSHATSAHRIYNKQHLDVFMVEYFLSV
jgi:hypothetical protein